MYCAIKICAFALVSKCLLFMLGNMLLIFRWFGQLVMRNGSFEVYLCNLINNHLKIKCINGKKSLLAYSHLDMYSQVLRWLDCWEIYSVPRIIRHLKGPGQKCRLTRVVVISCHGLSDIFNKNWNFNTGYPTFSKKNPVVNMGTEQVHTRLIIIGE